MGLKMKRPEDHQRLQFMIFSPLHSTHQSAANLREERRVGLGGKESVTLWSRQTYFGSCSLRSKTSEPYVLCPNGGPGVVRGVWLQVGGLRRTIEHIDGHNRKYSSLPTILSLKGVNLAILRTIRYTHPALHTVTCYAPSRLSRWYR